MHKRLPTVKDMVASVSGHLYKAKRAAAYLAPCHEASTEEDAGNKPSDTCAALAYL